jgi:hypothetical protein
MRPILNFAPYEQTLNPGRICHPGVSFVPQGWDLSPGGEFCPLGVKLSPGVEILLSILLNSRECSPLGLSEGVNIPPRGQISPLSDKSHPMGPSSHLEVKCQKIYQQFPLWGAIIFFSKMGFLVWKQTIWQPWSRVAYILED